MDSATPRVLCCIGASIGGQPTQFVTERAIASAGLDWRVITVEVQPDSLSAALAGAQAMGFEALRFFQPFFYPAAKLIAVEETAIEFIGGITSARRSPGGWRSWHNSGPALIDCLVRQCDWRSAVCWLSGDSQDLRSLLVACQETSPRVLIWTDGPPVLPDRFAGTIRRIPDDWRSELPGILKTELDSVPNPTLVVAGRIDDELCELLARLEVNESCRIVVFDTSENFGSGRNFRWQGPPATKVSSAQFEIAKECVDFKCWTDLEPDATLFNEAYEEYMDL